MSAVAQRHMCKRASGGRAKLRGHGYLRYVVVRLSQ